MLGGHAASKCSREHRKCFCSGKPNSSQGDPQDSEIGDKINCYVNNIILYPVKDHPMHKDCE